NGSRQCNSLQRVTQTYEGLNEVLSPLFDSRPLSVSTRYRQNCFYCTLLGLAKLVVLANAYAPENQQSKKLGDRAPPVKSASERDSSPRRKLRTGRREACVATRS